MGLTFGSSKSCSPSGKSPQRIYCSILGKVLFCNSPSSRGNMEEGKKKKKRRTKETTKTPKSLILSLLGCSEIWGSPRYDHLFDDIHHTYSGNKTKPYKLKTDLLYIGKLCFNAQVRMKSMFSQWVEKRQITTMLKVWWFGFFYTHSMVYNEDGKNPRNCGGRKEEPQKTTSLLCYHCSLKSCLRLSAVSQPRKT